ncbi:hypothetical protein MMC20_004983 [Loxospora ochrophaea]|nr:hypothetical protein [Loxospora ochrophaea]
MAKPKEQTFTILEDQVETLHDDQEPSEQVRESSQTEEERSEDDWDASDSSESQGNVDDAVLEDLQKFEDTFDGISDRFRLIKRIGEGTFSTVYKAEDLLYEHYHNDWDIEARDSSPWSSPPVKRGANSQDINRRRGPRYVAIKKIYVTSSPSRIQNELELLYDLKGCNSVCPLITAFRHHDQVVAVLPYFRHQDFREYFRQMLPQDMRVYFRSLFVALAAVHKQGILHRDIKPTNFLYDIHRQRGVLVDFGLAEREGTDCSYCICREPAANRRIKIESSIANQNGPSIGYPKNDTRQSRRANRAGTRGFRAPEVLLKCTSQTTKIDVWSAGIILLTILSRRFPFFNSADDVDAMIEIAAIFGRQRMRACALLHGSVFETDIPSIGEKGFSLQKLISWSIARTEDTRGDVQDLTEGEKFAIRFLERCLELDPKKRISASQALEHEFLNEDLPSEAGEDAMEVL